MILSGENTENGWITLGYQSTWPFFYEAMLCAAEEIIEMDFKDQLGRLAVQDPGSNAIECLEKYESNGGNLRAIPEMCEEHGCVVVSGYSSIMECNIQFRFYNQTNRASIQTNNLEYVKEHSKDVFTNYFNSIEIKTYIRFSNKSTDANPGACVNPAMNEEYIKKLPFMKRLRLLFG